MSSRSFMHLNENLCRFKAEWSLGGVLVILILCFSCRNPHPSWIESEPGNSVLDLEYINDTLGLIVRDIRVIPENDSKRYQVRVYLEGTRRSGHWSDHSFYVHFYPIIKTEAQGGFYPSQATPSEVRRGVWVFAGTFESDLEQFEMLRFGLVDGNRRRLFTLAVDSIPIRIR